MTLIPELALEPATELVIDPAIAPAIELVIDPAIELAPGPATDLVMVLGRRRGCSMWRETDGRRC